MELYTYFISFFESLKYIIILTCFLFFLFEILPLLFGAKNTIRKNLHDLFVYNLARVVIVHSMGIGIILLLFLVPVEKQIIDLTHFSTLSQSVILYFCIELLIYGGHRAAHRYKVPFITKAHGFHHKIKDNLQWVNSKKESLIVIFLFLVVFCFFYYIAFKTNSLAKIIVAVSYLTLNSFSHFHTPFTIPYLNYIFLFPKEHKEHHIQFGGPYGVSLSLFDTLFNTRKK